MRSRLALLANGILMTDRWLFSSITASYKVSEGLINFVPFSDDDPDIGYLEVDPSVVSFIINDGQHRAAGIKEALPKSGSLKDESISVLLFPYERLDRVQQMFTDLNKNVVKPSKSLNILYDHRDPLAEAFARPWSRSTSSRAWWIRTRRACPSGPIFSSRSPRFTTPPRNCWSTVRATAFSSRRR
jgi:DNA sulfur modification protein DndB